MFCDFNNPTATCPICTFDARILPIGFENATRKCDGRPMPHRKYTGPWPRTDTPPPSLARQAWSYATAVAKWTAAGQPNRTDTEVAELLKICQACPHFIRCDSGNDIGGKCGLCGCPCNESGSALQNKLRMATEHCPDEPAKW
jgi:hypothetical protein